MKYFAIITSPEMLIKLASGKYTADLRRKHLNLGIEPIKVLLVNNRNGVVVGEYIFQGEEKIRIDRYSTRAEHEGKGGYSIRELEEYRAGSSFYLWHFTNFVMYNRPYEIGKYICESTGAPFGKRTKFAYVRLEE